MEAVTGIDPVSDRGRTLSSLLWLMNRDYPLTKDKIWMDTQLRRIAFGNDEQFIIARDYIWTHTQARLALEVYHP
jgi:hypothetical protein